MDGEMRKAVLRNWMVGEDARRLQGQARRRPVRVGFFRPGLLRQRRWLRGVAVVWSCWMAAWSGGGWRIRWVGRPGALRRG